MPPHPSPSQRRGEHWPSFTDRAPGHAVAQRVVWRPATLTRRSRTAHAPAECPAAPGPRAPGGRPGRRRTMQAAARAAEHARHILQHIVRLQLVLAHKHYKHSREA